MQITVEDYVGEPLLCDLIVVINMRFILSFAFFLPVVCSAQDARLKDAWLIFKSKGDAMNVVFHTSTDEKPCEKMTRAASVYDASLLREKLLPFIAKMQQKARAVASVYPEMEIPITAGLRLQVFGQSEWSDKVGNTRTFGKCGPFTQVFTPQAGHKYLALFEFAGDRCGQSVQDITDEASPIPVEFKPLHCARP